jgi:hypothetical protein
MNSILIALALIALSATVLACAWLRIPERNRHSVAAPVKARFRRKFVAAAMRRRITLFMLGVQEALVLPTRHWRRLKPFKASFANIAEGVHESAITRKTDAAITARHLLYKKGTDADHIAVGGASDLPIGTVADEAKAAEESVAVQLLGHGPTKRMVASEAISAGVNVYAAASGKIATSGTVFVGVSLDAAGADGDVIEVLDSSPPPAPGIATSLYDAHTILYATTDNTPVALTVGASRIVGRKSTGNIIALTGAETRVIEQGVDNITAGVVAAAGTTVADAAQLAASAVTLISSDGATKGVKLPTGVAGMVIDVIATTATAAELYAASGGTVNGLAPDASIVVPASKGVRCFCTAADTWTVFDLTAKATAS